MLHRRDDDLSGQPVVCLQTALAVMARTLIDEQPMIHMIKHVDPSIRMAQQPCSFTQVLCGCLTSSVPRGWMAPSRVTAASTPWVSLSPKSSCSSMSTPSVSKWTSKSLVCPLAPLCCDTGSATLLIKEVAGWLSKPSVPCCRPEQGGEQDGRLRRRLPGGV